MPTIEISWNMLEKLAGRKVKHEDLEIVKGGVDAIEGDIVKVEIGDTNRPDLWCVEGIARGLREKGLPKLKVAKSGKKIVVDKKIKGIRPFIAGFVAKNVDVSEEMLLDLIQLQEKIAENFGKKRMKISVGIYDYDKIKFPVHYKAVEPASIKFIPLDFEHPKNLHEILQEHPKGVQYGYILKEHKLYPIFIDSQDEVLSFPPIINSSFLGKVETGKRNLFVEVTGTVLKTVLIATNILAYSLADRKAKIKSTVVEYPWQTEYGKKIETPYLFKEKIVFEKQNIEKILGIKLNDAEIKKLLDKMQYDANVSKNAVSVVVPPYRNDIMHFVDVIEDLAIAYGYNNFSSLDIETHTTGRLKEKTEFYETVRRNIIGLGFQEIMSPILSSRKHVCENMCVDEKIVEIENIMSESYSVVRSWVLPSLLNCLTKNMHNEFPQRVFELGEVVIRDDTNDDGTRTLKKVAACVSDNVAGYEEISSVLDSMLRAIGLVYELKYTEHNSFIPGRCARVFAEENEIGIVGEIHPQVLNNWGLEKPVAGFELNVSKIFQLVKK